MDDGWAKERKSRLKWVREHLDWIRAANTNMQTKQDAAIQCTITMTFLMCFAFHVRSWAWSDYELWMAMILKCYKNENMQFIIVFSPTTTAASIGRCALTHSDERKSFFFLSMFLLWFLFGRWWHSSQQERHMCMNRRKTRRIKLVYERVPGTEKGMKTDWLWEMRDVETIQSE